MASMLVSMSSDNVVNNDPNISFNTSEINDDDYVPIWKFTKNSSVIQYEWVRKLRTKILLDLKRHFGREVKHNRLFSCLCK